MILKWIFDRGGSPDRIASALAGIADNGGAGEGEDVGRSRFLCAEESGEGW